MKLNRRRFLAAGFGLFSGQLLGSDNVVWRDQALGARVSISVPRYLKSRFEADLADLVLVIKDIESIFSLYHTNSLLNQLNQNGVLYSPPLEMITLLDQVKTVHDITAGNFDPTIQPLWKALAWGGDVESARSLIGFHKITITQEKIELSQRHMALSFNGIIQGYLTDKVTAFLKNKGYPSALVNMGEFSAIGDVWTVGVANNDGHLIHERELNDSAIATSAPLNMTLAQGSHILPVDSSNTTIKWKTVSVEAQSSAIADGVSTGLVYTPYNEARALIHRPEIKSLLLESLDGEVIRIS